MRLRIFFLLLLSGVVSSGCFSREPPNPEVIADSCAELERLGASVTVFNASAYSMAVGAADAVAKTQAVKRVLPVPQTFPESFAEYPGLRKIFLRGNHALADPLPESLFSASSLQTLDLSELGLASLPENLSKCASLRELYLADNRFSSFPGVICSLPGLTYLNLDRNALTELPPEAGLLKNLKWLRLNENRLSALPEELGALKQVRRLYLRKNQFTEFPAVILQMENLEELDLGENRITEIPEALCNLKKLRRIDLDGNAELSKLPDSLSGMPQLTHLFIGHCNFSREENERIRKIFPDPIKTFIDF